MPSYGSVLFLSSSLFNLIVGGRSWSHGPLLPAFLHFIDCFGRITLTFWLYRVHIYAMHEAIYWLLTFTGYHFPGIS